MSLEHKTQGRILDLGVKSLAAAVAMFAILAVAAPLAAATTTDTQPVTFSKDIAPILQRSCQRCHQPDSVAPMSLLTYDQVRPYAKSHPQARPHGPGDGRDAALVHREEHRDPAVQGRPFAERGRAREDRAVGDRRRARGQPGRSAAADQAQRRHQVVDRRAGPHHQARRRDPQGRRARLVGRDPAGADRQHRGSLRRRGRDPRGQRRAREPRQESRPRRRSAAATSSTT